MSPPSQSEVKSSFKEWKICHVILFLTFVISGLAINLVQFTLYAVIVKVMGNRDLFRRVNYYLIWAIYAQLLFLAEWWSQTRIRVLTDEDDEDKLAKIGHEHALIVMNHHYEVDWLLGWMVADRFATLGNARVFLKKSLKFVPIIGWGWSLSDVGFLHREWDKDKELIKQRVKDLESYPDPAWLLLFAEGTRLSPEKLALSQAFAKERGLKELKHHLVPRTRGFEHIVKNVDTSKMGVIYDVTIINDENNGFPKPTLTNVLLGKTPECSIYVRRIPINEEIKADPAAFLHQLYLEKDEIKGSFLATGTAPPRMPVNVVPLERRSHSWWLMVTLTLLVMLPLFNIFLGMSLVAKAVCVALLLLLSFGMDRMISITKIDQGSKYGQAKKEK